MRVSLLSLVAVVAIGCGSSTPATAPDLSMPMSSGGDMAVYSLCGHPGDTGNSLGVGHYCMDSMDCKGLQAPVCSTVMPIMQGPIYFCTIQCDPNATTSTCGAGATCTCLDPNNPALCGCVPDPCRIGLFG
jgi:hypothetical protein